MASHKDPNANPKPPKEARYVRDDKPGRDARHKSKAVKRPELPTAPVVISDWASI